MPKRNITWFACEEGDVGRLYISWLEQSSGNQKTRARIPAQSKRLFFHRKIFNYLEILLVSRSIIGYLIHLFRHITLADKKEIYSFLQGIKQLFQGNSETLNQKLTIILFNQLLFLRYCKKAFLISSTISPVFIR